MPLTFTLQANDGHARAGQLQIRGIEVLTPAFMPVGTNGTVKALTNQDLIQIGYPLILANTYHLHLRPGDTLIKNLGGLHRFMGWDQLILTDSGGFQVFSLAKLNKITPEGVHFQNHLDGSPMFLSPESAIEIQENLGSDIMMVLDECLPIPSDKSKVAKSIKLTTDWAVRSLKARQGQGNLFSIVQGADYEDLRLESAQMLMEHDFDGFAIGGLSVGEAKEVMYAMANLVAPRLPVGKPRYLMGVGDPSDLLNAIESGVDLFDCVLPTRNARNGSLLTPEGWVHIKQARYKEDPAPLESDCPCTACRDGLSKAYLRHLFLAGEMLSGMLNSRHNLTFLYRLMSQARQAIAEGRFAAFKRDFLSRFAD